MFNNKLYNWTLKISKNAMNKMEILTYLEGKEHAIVLCRVEKH